MNKSQLDTLLKVHLLQQRIKNKQVITGLEMRLCVQQQNIRALEMRLKKVFIMLWVSNVLLGLAVLLK